jgi:hypothetical protein
MKSLETKYGPVRHIILGTVALEHKVRHIKEILIMQVCVCILMWKYSIKNDVRQLLVHSLNDFQMQQSGCNLASGHFPLIYQLNYLE